MKPIWEKRAFLIRGNSADTLVIADLHLGFELDLATKGVFIPDRTESLAKEVLDLPGGEVLVIAGDLKHSIGLAAGHRVKKFLEIVEGRFGEIILVVGNHDGSIASVVGDSVRLHGSSGLEIDGVWVFHGHARPAEGASETELGVMGHVHPAIRFSGIGKVPVWVVGRTKCEGLPERIIILPPFNDLLGYGDLLELTERGPVFPKCIDPSETEVFTLRGEYLGTLEFLRGESGKRLIMGE